MDAPGHIHGVAVAVAVDPDGPLAGALLLGPPGAGKSALALSLIEACPYGRTALVADDVVVISTEGGAVFARAPEKIRGLIELRGYGPARVRAAPRTRLVAAFEIAGDVPRLPQPVTRRFGGAEVPAWPFAREGDAPARIRLILRSILGGQTP